MKSLLISSIDLPPAAQLARASLARGWQVVDLSNDDVVHVAGDRTYYGDVDTATAAALEHRLALIEPPLGLLASVPHGLLHRSVRYATRGQIEPIDQPAFIKPADPLAKTFDAGVYHDLRDLARGRPIPDDTPVLISDPVEWSSEFRCFILDGQIAAWSPYLSFGRTAWRPGQTGVMPRPLGEFVAELGVALSGDLPPAYVVDVGLLDGDQWAVVEFNPVWCSGILGADPDNVLTVIERAAMPIDSLPELDRRWLIRGDDGQSR